MNIADRIQHLRKTKGISQEELADKIGVSRQAVSKWESEQSIPDIDKVILLSEYFETTTDFLLKGIEPIKEIEPMQKPKEQFSAILFSIAGTVLNVIGLIVGAALWFERSIVLGVGVGLAVMLLGTGVFLVGQNIDTLDKQKAKRLFLLPNVWILSFIPAFCCIEVFVVFLCTFAHLPEVCGLGNAFVPFVICGIVYIIVCAVIDVIIAKKTK